MAKVNLQEMFVVKMERLISELDEIDLITPFQNVEPEWWIAMVNIRKSAFNAVQKFKTNQSQSNAS